RGSPPEVALPCGAAGARLDGQVTQPPGPRERVALDDARRRPGVVVVDDDRLPRLRQRLLLQRVEQPQQPQGPRMGRDHHAHRERLRHRCRTLSSCPVRVLAVGNMYPPHHFGGYELVWRSAVEHLRSRGHEVHVLTTGHREKVGLDEAADVAEADISRALRWYWRDHRFPRIGLRARIELERENWRTLERHLAEHRPDVVAWWAMGGMSLSLIERVRLRGIAAVAFVND